VLIGRTARTCAAGVGEDERGRESRGAAQAGAVAAVRQPVQRVEDVGRLVLRRVERAQRRHERLLHLGVGHVGGLAQQVEGGRRAVHLLIELVLAEGEPGAEVVEVGG
jgi:hypothetical protein